MITGAIRTPFRDNPHQNQDEINKIVKQAQQQIDQLLAHPA